MMKPWPYTVLILLLLTLGHTYGEVSIANWGTEPLDDGARCDVNAVRRANREQLHLLLEELTNTTFFRLFRVGLDGECPIKSSNSTQPISKGEQKTESAIKEEPTCSSPPESEGEGLCSLNLGDPSSSSAFGADRDLPPWVLHKQPVDRTMSSKEQKSVESDLSCETPDFWFDMCHGLLTQDESKGWINLQLNPERHTGYNGSRVWEVIYEQACFADQVFSGDNSTTPNATVSTCGHEKRVLQRLISGLHASINTHIALFYHPPSFGSNSGATPTSLSGGGTVASAQGEWRSNPARFMETVGAHPDRVRNLNFAFVVLLRALRKAAPILGSFSYAVSGDAVEDFRTAALVRRLLDSHLMSSCSQVFDSFDESLMFQGRTSELKKSFKDAFLNIARTLDCIRCQKCRLHGKMQLTGIGLALKILLLPEDVLRSTPVTRLARREEIVALFNTVHKFSHAIASVDFLTELHLAGGTTTPEAKEAVATELTSSSTQRPIDPSPHSPIKKNLDGDDLNVVVESIARAYFAGALDDSQERTLLEMAKSNNNKAPIPFLVSLARGYGALDPSRFALHVKRLVLQSASSGLAQDSHPLPKQAYEKRVAATVVVIGSGLAGSSAVLTLLDSTVNDTNMIAKVYLVDKQTFLGGNSVYASSGMNAVDGEARALGDSVEAFAQDIAKSSGKGTEFASDAVVRALAVDSEDALQWVRTRIGQRFEKIGRLGGHSFPRTHRPEHGQAGAELVYAMHRLLKSYVDTGRLEILRGERVDDISKSEDSKWKVKTASGYTISNVSAVVFASGGYAANKNLLPRELRHFGTTNGAFATGDAISILATQGAVLRDMDRVQLHPTAFAQEDKSQQQPLCAEILRGVGGVLLRSGLCERFSDELGTRAYISEKMIESGDSDFVIVLSEDQARQADHFRSVYTKRGLLEEKTSLDQVAQFARCTSKKTLISTLDKYTQAARVGRDEFNKTTFPMAESLLAASRYYVGKVQPAVHYCMGGVASDEFGRVLTDNGAIPGLYACGEVTGGLHGNNRLGGNGMTEGLVFGRRAARGILNDLFNFNIVGSSPAKSVGEDAAHNVQDKSQQVISPSELAKHNIKSDCWVAIHDKVYDFTQFLNEHPGGVKPILDLAGKDGSEMYDEIHTAAFLDDFTPVGRWMK